MGVVWRLMLTIIIALGRFASYYIAMKTLTIIIAVLALFGCQPERETPAYGLAVKRVTFEPDPFDPNGYMVARLEQRDALAKKRA